MRRIPKRLKTAFALGTDVFYGKSAGVEKTEEATDGNGFSDDDSVDGSLDNNIKTDENKNDNPGTGVNLGTRSEP